MEHRRTTADEHKFHAIVRKFVRSSVRCRFMMHRDDREAVGDEHEFYASDLAGCRVELQETESECGHERNGTVLGTVTDVYDAAGAHDTLGITFASGLVIAPDGRLVDVAELNAWVRA